ncbi:hypothetical protein LVO39_003101 [Salmonella enterica]|uniref:Uncharacterized protein n=1 Tax=Salmonella newport TaxID=108619 RepID=A0A5Y0S399_SALNE|nr:hypothetical protein [Salmonella enterica]EBS4089153.1 hypothetical protein [Salmonella enterica subsp. enterica serovar Newport]ECC9936370.1 hypothetical protein [Salmonella enterica subsp. enterica]ECD7245009.1 hypothetical protein [Salmonella enterica subsp. enterica serovar Florida]EBS4409221.1 hypothetical protein [Salmonella enterica subsp. enterica serovar Newport]
MNFSELNSATQEKARETLKQILVARKQLTEDECKRAAGCVSAAFIAMERFDGAPDECED